MSVNSPMDPQLAAKRSVCFKWLSKWLTAKVIIRWTNHVSSFILGNFGMPYHAFDMNFAFDGHFTGARDNVRQSKRKYQGEILLCLSTVRNLQGCS